MQLFKGEKINFSEPTMSVSPIATNEEIDEKYVRGDVRIVTEQARYPLNAIVTMLDTGDYNLNPDFQRRRRWSTVKQSRLVESFIMNVPIPPIFLYEVAYSNYEVMDGLQRLTAISEFYKGCFKLTGLSQWPELNGKSYQELPEQVKRGIDRRYLSSIILLKETARDENEARRLKELVFERINSGGDKLEAQESRNALYNGPLNRICLTLARTTSFCKMWGIPTEEDVSSSFKTFNGNFSFDDEIDFDEETVPDILHANPLYRKMQDVELVLRFFAYRQIQDFEQGRLSDYLDFFLREGNNFPKDVLSSLEEVFVKTCDLAYEIFGEKAFHLLRKKRNGEWIWFERPTKVVYDPLMHALSQNIYASEVLKKRSSEIVEGLKELYREKSEAFKGRSTNKEDIYSRMNILSDFFSSFIV